MFLRSLWIALLSLALSSQWAAALSLADLRTASRVRLRDSSADVTYQRFSDATLNAFINEGQRDFLNQTWLLSGTVGFDLTAAVQTYALPTDYVATLRVTIAGKAIPEMTKAGLDSSQGATNWTVTQSTPIAYYIDPTKSATTMTVGFYPKPRLTTSGSQVQLDYIQQPTTLAADSDVPFNGKNVYLLYHDALSDYAAYEGWQLLGRSDLANAYLATYLGKAKLCKANLGQQPNYNPAATGFRGPPQQ